MYANTSKCIFGAEEIPFLGCFIGKSGLRAYPAKVKAIVDWTIPKNRKDLRKWLGLANYLHKYSENYADMARPFVDLLKNDTDWRWDNTHANAFRAKDILLHTPILALPNSEYCFIVFCNASDFSIAAPCYKQMSQAASALSHLNLVSGKMLKRTIQFMTKRYLLSVRHSSNLEFICLAPSHSSSTRIMLHYERQHSRPTSLREWLDGFPSLWK